MSEIKNRQTDIFNLSDDSEFFSEVKNYACRIILSMYFLINGITAIKAILQLPGVPLPLLILLV